MHKTPTLSSFLVMQQPLMALYEDIVKNNRIEVTKDYSRPDGLLTKMNYGGPFGNIIGAAADRGISTLMESYVTARFMVNGPKVFRPKANNCFAMEAIRPQVSFNEYQQPFDTFAVEFPLEYSEARKVDGIKPIAIILHRNTNFMLSSVLWDSGYSTENSFGPRDEEETIEQMLLRGHGKVWEESLPVTEKETDYTESAVRLGVNACMLLTHYGCKKIGYTNREHADRLQRRLLKKTKNSLKEQNERELKTQAVLYDFDQEVKLYDEVEENAPVKSDGVASRRPRPHWRTGHWRSQPFGTGRLERKRIFIKPVLINGQGLTNLSVLYRE